MLLFALDHRGAATAGGGMARTGGHRNVAPRTGGIYDFRRETDRFRWFGTVVANVHLIIPATRVITYVHHKRMRLSLEWGAITPHAMGMPTPHPGGAPPPLGA